MRTHILVPVVLAWGLLALGPAWGQGFESLETIPERKEPELPPPTEKHTIPLHSCPSPWLQYCRTGACYGPTGGSGPVQTELYLRSGLSFPFGNGVYGENLETGWIIAGGARVHFFTPDMNRAWLVDLGLSNMFNQAAATDRRVPLNILVPDPNTGAATRVGLGLAVPGQLVANDGVTIRDLNRTFVNLGVGHAWYLANPACGDVWGCRFLVDGGGRYGTTSAQFYEIRQREDVITGAYAGVEGNVEVPWGCCTFLGGLRLEYSYTWNEVLQVQNHADVQDINLLFTLGVRF